MGAGQDNVQHEAAWADPSVMDSFDATSPVLHGKDLNCVCGGMQTSVSLEVVGGDSVVRQLRLRALLPEGKLVFASKALDLGGIPVGVPQTSLVILKNNGLHDAMFQVSLHHSVIYTISSA